MPKFKITIADRIVEYRSKVFDANTEDDARALAEEDHTWGSEDGWEVSAERTGECGIEEVEEVSEPVYDSAEGVPAASDWRGDDNPYHEAKVK